MRLTFAANAIQEQVPCGTISVKAGQLYTPYIIQLDIQEKHFWDITCQNQETMRRA